MVKPSVGPQLFNRRKPKPHLWVSLLVPLLTVAFARVVDYDNALSDKGSEEFYPGSVATDLVEYDLENGVQREKRDVDASGVVVVPKYARDVAIFGMSFRYDEDKKRAAYLEDSITVLEGLPLTITFYGRFLNGTKVLLNENGHKCDDEKSEDAYDLLLDPAGDIPPFGPGYVYSVAKVSLTMPNRYDSAKVYFCLLNPKFDKWESQGTSRYVYIQLQSKMLPLWVHACLIVFLLCLSGLFSGLNLGLMSLNKTDLKIIINTGTPIERLYASKIAPVRNHGNFLLCCLLFSNVLVNATLTILMDELTSGALAIAISTLAIVVFGEIIPQAICSRHGLAVGAKTIYITKFFMAITLPLAYPLSMLLDKILGEEIGSVYTRERLKELLRVTKDHHGLETEEVALISGALDMKTKTVKDIMTRLDSVFMLPHETVLDYETISEIEFQGYTRIPVYEMERSNVVAVLNVKQLTLLDASDNIPIRTVVEYYQNSLFYVFENTRLDYMFRAFREGNRGHMAFVQKVNDEGPGDPYYETIGVVTMEDVLEELLQAEIMDETDVGKYKARLERKERPKDIPFLSSKRKQPTIEVPPPLALAACQFLTTAVPAFNRNDISENILNRLIKTTVTMVRPPKLRAHETPSYIYLYENGKPADYFIMILEGRVQVEVGHEKITFNAGPFQYFGAEFLLSQPVLENVVDLKDPLALPGSKPGLRKCYFTPDYSARVITDTFFMRVRFEAYHAARVATDLERKYSDPKQALVNQDWQQEVERILTAVDEDQNKHQYRMLCPKYSIEEIEEEKNAEDATVKPANFMTTSSTPPTKELRTVSLPISTTNSEGPSTSANANVIFKSSPPPSSPISNPNAPDA